MEDLSVKENTVDLSIEETGLIVELCGEVESQKDISWMGTDGFANAVDELWRRACQIGYAHGLEDAESRSTQASPVLAVFNDGAHTDTVDAPSAAPSLSVPQTPPTDPEIERILLETVPWDARKKGGRALQECLRSLWEKASSIAKEDLERVRQEGFENGKIRGREEEFALGVVSRKKTADAAEKQLEQERVWGYDVGWKLCSEQLQSRASQASRVPPSVSAVVTPTPAPLDWAEDAASLPLHAATLPPPRDFSALHTGALQPFGSLQHRRRRSLRLTTSERTPRHPRKPQQKAGTTRLPTQASLQNNPPHPQKINLYSVPKRLTSHPIPPSRVPAPTSIPSPLQKSISSLDWDQDPRLRDLGQALTALGWVRL
ncbi:hypothetical protein GGX14DRAFT_574594 [Mycena pura]|uniref:Uncharacterized protein n=1 Tax=Mycena pura TaxID=153505 RepID=A0AAD6Y8V9_9AGAR|nr:hypothetical protein GGX14DRAFT_574594 [Mycena pura]